MTAATWRGLDWLILSLFLLGGLPVFSGLFSFSVGRFDQVLGPSSPSSAVMPSTPSQQKAVRKGRGIPAPSQAALSPLCKLRCLLSTPYHSPFCTPDYTCVSLRIESYPKTREEKNSRGICYPALPVARLCWCWRFCDRDCDRVRICACIFAFVRLRVCVFVFASAKRVIGLGEWSTFEDEGLEPLCQQPWVPIPTDNSWRQLVFGLGP